jgi:hypothetical protein
LDEGHVEFQQQELAKGTLGQCTKMAGFLVPSVVEVEYWMKQY